MSVVCGILSLNSREKKRLEKKIKVTVKFLSRLLFSCLFIISNDHYKKNFTYLKLLSVFKYLVFAKVLTV